MSSRWEIVKQFEFEAAHRLPHAPEQHKCRRTHGHSYKVEVHLLGTPDQELGWVRDFADITQAFEPLRSQLDHQLLNDIDGLDNPTCEVLAAWIYNALAPSLPELHAITVHETATSRCTFRQS